MNGKWLHGLPRSSNNGMTNLWFLWDLWLYSTSLQFMCFSCGHGTWKMKTLLQDDFSSKLKKYIDFSVFNFRDFSFHLKIRALSQAQKPHGILEDCFIALIITSYKNGFSIPPERDGSRKKLSIYIVGMYLERVNPLMSWYSGQSVRNLVLWTLLQYDFESSISPLVLILPFHRKSHKKDTLAKNISRKPQKPDYSEDIEKIWHLSLLLSSP